MCIVAVNYIVGDLYESRFEIFYPVKNLLTSIFWFGLAALFKQAYRLLWQKLVNIVKLIMCIKPNNISVD